MRNQLVIILFVAALACTPKLQGTCSSNNDCQTGESCDPSGICLRQGTGNADAGDAGPGDAGPDGGAVATIEMVTPSAGSIEPSGFRVAAQATSNTPVNDVTFVVTSASAGAQVGSLVVTDGSNGAYSGNLLLDNSTFAGQANVRAVLHRTGLPDVQSAAVLITIDESAPNITTTFDGGGQWFAESATIDVTATVTDEQGVGEVDLVLPDGGSFIGAASTTNLYTFHVPASSVAPPGTEASVSFNLIATDNAGNHGALNNPSVLQVDNKPPVISAVTIDSAFDGTDSSGQGWFCGPTAIFGAAPIQVSATIADGFLVTSGSGAPAAVVGGTRIVGTLAGGRWSFSLPRSIGVNATGPITVAFDAQDQAGNHPASPPTLSLQFDDVPASAFAPQIAADSNWYSLSAVASLPINVTFGVLPRSGISPAGVVMKVAGKLDVTCTGADLSWTCVLPTSDAAAGAETILLLDVFVNSVTGIGSNGTSTRSIDDAPPTVTAVAAIPYPAAATGPLSWSHDGSHFNLRDSTTLYTFKAFDCGAGVQGAQSFSISPGLTSSSVSVTDSGARQACSNGVSAAVFNVSIVGNLATSAGGAFALADNTFTTSVIVQDAAKNGARGPAPHTTSATSPAINATRRLWQTTALGFNGVALGPFAIATTGSTLTALNPANGSTQWSLNAGNIFDGPAVGGTAAAPVVYYVNGTTSTSTGASGTLIGLNATTGAQQGTCTTTPTGALPAGCHATGGIHDDEVAIDHSGNGLIADSLTQAGTTTPGADCGGAASSVGQLSGATCTSAVSSQPSFTINNFIVGRNGQLFLPSSHVDNLGNPDNKFSLLEAGQNTTSAAVVSTFSCGNILLTDNGGVDSPICDTGSRYNFSGGAFSAALYSGGGGGGGLSAPAFNRYFPGTTGFAISTGQQTTPSIGGTLLALDASSPPIAYLSSGATLSAIRFNAGVTAYGSAAWTLPAFPGSSISDMAIDKSGNLFVVSNGQVSAVATESPGLGIGSFGWPTRRRDACRSNSLDFTCPF